MLAYTCTHKWWERTVLYHKVQDCTKEATLAGTTYFFFIVPQGKQSAAAGEQSQTQSEV